MPDLDKDQPEPRFQPVAHGLALFVAVMTWPLLLSGGRVTTYRVGMAVPDWPTTFGINMFLYNFWNSPLGVFIEHTHRLHASALGLAVIVLALGFTLTERRRGMKVLGWVALLSVILQGVLGGLRVRYVSTDLAFVHGCTAQAFFGLMVALCVLTGRSWAVGIAQEADPDNIRRRSIVTLGLIYAQIVAGAWLRHFGAGLMVHALLALGVWGHSAVLVAKVERRKSMVPQLVASARAMGLLVTIQIGLGVATWWMLRPFDGLPHAVTGPQALIRTGHLANGALLLASAVVLAFRSHRGLLPTTGTVASGRTHPREIREREAVV